VTACTDTVALVTGCVVFDRFSTSSTPSIVEPGGTAAATSKAINARRSLEDALTPANK
jgi:hypothetical protein